MKKILLFMVAALLVFGMVSCDQEVKAKTYKVAYNANGAVGNVPATIEVEEGETITVSSHGSLSMKGYDFAEWNTKNDGIGNVYRESQSLKADRDIVLYAQWCIHSYSTSYDLDGGSYPEGRSNQNKYTIETETFTLVNPEKDGYEFLGWTTSENGEPNKNVSIDKGTTGDLSFRAVWRSLKSYSISYDANGGEGSTETARKSEGESVEIASASGISRKGYEFVCWNTESDGSGKDYNPKSSYEEDADLRLYAKWSIINYSIEYNLNDGKLATGKSNPVEYTVETADIILENPTRYGYEFVGWRYKGDSDVSANKNFSIKKGTTGDLSIVAVWKALDTYTVSYDANGGTGTVETQSKYKGESLTISSGENLERVGYTFFCWNTKADGTGKDYNPNDTFSTDADLRLYAKWNLIKYSIKYELNGGAFPDGSSITEYTIETDTFTLPIPTKEEYGFIGWLVENSNEAQKTVSIEKGSTGDFNFTAVWRKLNRYTISYDVNGGTGSIESQSKLEGDSITIFDAVGIKRKGYEFVCWNTKSDGSGTDYKPNDEYIKDEDLVLYAKWNPIKYSITYDLAGGTLLEGKSNPSDYTIETETFSLVNPEKEGCIFVGWKESGSKDETAAENVSILKGSFGNKSFVAVWRLPKKYTVTFNANGAAGTPPDPLTVYEGDFFTVPSCGSIYDDRYVFCGWRTNSYGGTLYKPTEMVEISKDIVLYASWYYSPLKYAYLSETDSYSVTKYDSTHELNYFAIPPMYKGKPISEIGDSAFSNKTFIRSISIPESVTSIGGWAFSDCSGLTSIAIPESVTSIGNSAFSGCSGITSVAIPDSVTSIGNNAFIGCSGLTSVTIPDSVTSIGGWAFSGCSGLTSIAIPDSVTSIGNSAFLGCSGLEFIEVEAGNSAYYSDGNCLIVRDTKELVLGCSNSVIPDDVKNIGSHAFENCSSLTSITIPSSVTHIESEVFKNCSNLTSVTISEGVETIGESAFYNCGGLTSVTIPDSVTSIGDGAFFGCSGLESITIPSSVTSIGASAFSNCSGLTNVAIQKSITSIEYAVFSGCSKLASIMIPDSVTSIGKSAFQNCSSLTEITIPNDVVSIGGYAFAGCSGLTNVSIPASVATMGKYEFPKIVSGIFDGCNGLTVQFEEGTTKIPDYALYWSSGIESVKIPSSVTSIGMEAFVGCRNLKAVFADGMESIPSDALLNASGVVSVVIPESVTSIGDRAFSGCSGLASITIPESVTSIGFSAFSGCSGLESITIPESVTSIGDRAFWGCSGLESITIPEGVTSIGDYAFNGCSGLTGITIPDSVTTIGSSAFWGCSGLESITIPEGVTSIGFSAFRDCSGLTSITIPGSVTSIGEEAFSGCSGLTEIEIPSSVTSIGSSAFWGCSGLTEIEIPSNVTNIGSSVFYGCNDLSIVFAKGLKFIPEYALYGASGIVSVSIPSSVTSIGSSAFSGCSGLTEIEIPSNVTNIGSSVFSGCTDLSIVFAKGMESIPSDALRNASGVVSVVIPESVTSIGDYAFQGCSGLESITILDGVTRINGWAFSGCTGLAIITIPSSVTNIGWSAFEDCTGLASINYSGTKVQWNSITKDFDWNYRTGNYTIHCTDGDIAKN